MKKHKQKSLKKLNIVALIPARGGSKTIKAKNLYLLGSKPLLSWSIDAAKKEKIFNRIFVSTDNKNIAFYSKLYGAEVHHRPKKISQDYSLVSDTINNFINHLRDELKYKIDILVLLEPTSPFREKNLIKNCISKMIRKKKDTIATFVKAETDPKKVWDIDNNGNPTAHYKKGAWLPRQKIETNYELDGSVYAFNIINIKKIPKNLLFGKATSMIRSSKDFVDINNIRDINLAKTLLENKK